MSEKDLSLTKKAQHSNELPVVALRDVVIYPSNVLPLFVGRKRTIKAVELAMNLYDKKVLLVAQKKAMTEDPKPNDLYNVGTIGSILQFLKLPDGTVKILVEGEQRASIQSFGFKEETVFGKFSVIKETIDENNITSKALVRSTLSLFEQYARHSKKIPVEIISVLSTIESASQIIDSIAAHVFLKIEEKQLLLETFDLQIRAEKLLKFIEREIEVMSIEKKIGSRVKGQIEKNQREYYLTEQMKAIQKELGELENLPNEQDLYLKKIKKSGMPKLVQEKAKAELNKLKLMPHFSAEATVSRNYLDALIAVPWTKETSINRDLMCAEKILNEEHYGLDKVKERILEYLAVQHRVSQIKGPILCLVGPPGVGKTSLGKSIAHATGRKFARMSLGGVRDEAEIRGHRRTYVGALPGKVIYHLSKVGVRNPLFLLDEIDKMTMDFRGDPSSALLEVLDPEQNSSFNDHYLEVDYDLSHVMFVTTANTLDIPPALLDRMEVIHLSGYTEDEKIHIATQHLLPKQIKESGLKTQEILIRDTVIRDIIRYYTREAGVRNLERELAKLCRKVVKRILLDKKLKKLEISSDNLEDYLGVRRYRYGAAEENDQVGQVTGLAWTEVGGELLTIEAASMPGKGEAIVTGQIGEVMQESIKAAMTIVRSRAEAFGIDPHFFEKNDTHIHVPEGAIPKDGPSAGIAMCTAIISILTKTPVHANVAMTGEITLRGEVLPIGGLKEKLLAARRGNIQHVIIPKENIKDLKEIPDDVKENLKIHPVRWIEDVLRLALQHYPKPLKTKKQLSRVSSAKTSRKKNTKK
ncbi:MAG: endopeptidase La [Gammaproteobacteria bacterium GWF2_41_13]|nr:MAG: endopeptidase La [Gammaproteobacteria bacterium GWF2_41_13]